MKFYLEQIQVLEDNTEAKALFEYNSQDEAEIAYHNTMSASIDNPEVKYVRCKVIAPTGGEVFLDEWKAEDAEIESKFYLSQIQYPNSGDSAKALFDYPTYDAALDAWHSVIANTMSNTDYKAVMAMIEDLGGTTLKHRYWQKAEEI